MQTSSYALWSAGSGGSRGGATRRPWIRGGAPACARPAAGCGRRAAQAPGRGEVAQRGPCAPGGVAKAAGGVPTPPVRLPPSQSPARVGAVRLPLVALLNSRGTAAGRRDRPGGRPAAAHAAGTLARRIPRAALPTPGRHTSGARPAPPAARPVPSRLRAAIRPRPPAVGPGSGRAKPDIPGRAAPHSRLPARSP